MEVGVPCVWFVAELNTSSIPEIVMEVVVDGIFDGYALSSNIFWIGIG